MGDTIGTQGVTTVAPDKGYDRRHWRDRDSRDWNTLTITSQDAILLARQRMGVQSSLANPKLDPLTFKVDPEAQSLFIDRLRGGLDGDEAFIAVLNLKPCPVYLRRGVNQILMHQKRS